MPNMDVIDGITLQFMANMNHYNKYLEKNETSKITIRDLSFYHERFLELTRLLCQNRLPHTKTNNQQYTPENTTTNQQTTVHPENQQNTQHTPNEKLLDVGNIYTVNEEIHPPNHAQNHDNHTTTSQNCDIDNQNIHQDVQDAFNRYLETSLTYFQFIDRSNELQKEYDGMQTNNTLINETHTPFDLQKFQMEEILHQDNEKNKKCTLDLFVNKHKSTTHNKKIPTVKRLE